MTRRPSSHHRREHLLSVRGHDFDPFVRLTFRGCWVSRVARNAVIDEYRRAARAREHLEPAPEDVAIEDRDDMDDESTVLTDLTRCPLLDGLPQAAAARMEGVSLSGMTSRVQRGRRRLAELLEQCCTLTLDARGVLMDYARSSGCDGAAAAVDPFSVGRCGWTGFGVVPAPASNSAWRTTPPRTRAARSALLIMSRGRPRRRGRPGIRATCRWL